MGAWVRGCAYGGIVFGLEKNIKETNHSPVFLPNRLRLIDMDYQPLELKTF